ncbi:MAG: cysteine methyltransferase [Anaerolineales bacterium]|nr:cysteine methyltransferase [Anaerolineales bacterium]
MSRNTVRPAFNRGVYEIVRAIPSGRVMTYGGIAALIPPPRGIDYTAYARVRARWAGYALATCPDDVPWHRVINAQGRVSSRPGFGPQLQRKLLEDEGVVFDDKDRIDLRKFSWEPATEWLLERGMIPPSSRRNAADPSQRRLL